MVYVFHSIDNFRDLAETVQRRSRVCSKSIFRSATLDYATEDDIGKLVQELKVNTILDLRSEIEAQISKLGKPFVSFPVATALKMKPSDMTDPDPEPSIHEEPGPTRKTIMINFAGQKFRKYAVWKAAPLKTKMQIVGLIASGQKPKAVKLVGEEIIAKKGLTGLYRDFIDYCDQEICEALQVLSDPSNYPVLIHCTQGKDRTGLVTALALAAAGIEEEKIIEDYAKSQEGLARVREHMVKEMEKDGLDPSFADAPPDVMRRTFDYIREKYTDVNGYLDYIGFGEREREGLRRALTFKAWQLEAQQSMQLKASDGASLPPPIPEKMHSRARNISNSSTGSATSGYDTDSVLSSSSGSPWSPDAREKPRELGRSLGVPIGGSRRRRSESETPQRGIKYLIANPRIGVEMLGSAVGLSLPLSEDKHHRRSSSVDDNNDELQDDGFLPPKLSMRSPLGAYTRLPNSPPEPSPSRSRSPSPSSAPPPLPPKPRTSSRSPARNNVSPARNNVTPLRNNNSPMRNNSTRNSHSPPRSRSPSPPPLPPKPHKNSPSFSSSSSSNFLSPPHPLSHSPNHHVQFMDDHDHSPNHHVQFLMDPHSSSSSSSPVHPFSFPSSSPPSSSPRSSSAHLNHITAAN